ncbi:hypothetical protein P7F88_10050 [Vibrio hannami]|uniref:hypothetical protein n=1 Tax=Vibrio hannami TaxID=2717094 RepID=UPI002410B598|nr:hypothetical protein [Vibrio hannami]MDG3086434.1 hypothetical protein [Vibrio hannami]
MFSQSLPAQLLRMLVLLIVTLIAVHHSEPLLNLLAEQGMGSGCHQNSSKSENHHAHHHH